MQGNHSIEIMPFAERHFISTFAKKHKSHWDVTLVAIKAELERIEALLQTDRAEIISDGGDVRIVKTKFKVATTHESAKTSGNRCIVAWCLSKRTIQVLLVYGKTDLHGSNETSEWKRLVRDNYSDYKELCK